jgi:hypothetical protein
MVRKTITLPESTVDLVRTEAREGESFSATVTRLIEQGARLLSEGRTPGYVGSGEGPPDLSLRVEEYIREAIESR